MSVISTMKRENGGKRGRGDKARGAGIKELLKLWR